MFIINPESLLSNFRGSYQMQMNNLTPFKL